MRSYPTADTIICSENQTDRSPFPTPDDELETIKRPGGTMVLNYRKVVDALTKTVSSFELSRQIYG